MVKYKTIKAIFLLSLLTIPIGKVVAGIAITPAFIRLSETIQDKTYNIPVTVTNQSPKKTEYFLVNVEAPQASINGLPASKVLKWLKVKPSKVTVQPGESRKVMLTVKVPKGYTGDYRIYLSIMQDPRKYDLQIKQKKIKSQVGLMQLGKTSTRLPEFKTHIKALVKVNVPVVIRALKPGQKPKLRSKDISISKLSVMPSNKKGSAMTLISKVKNRSRFDIVLRGGCTVLNKKGTKKLMRASLEQGQLLQPKVVAKIECNFNSPLPRGRYRAQGDFTAEIKNARQKLLKITKRNKIKIDKNLANQMAGTGTVGAGNNLVTPLLLSTNMVQQEVFNGKVRKVTIEVTNPTNKKMTVRTKFKLTNKNRVKAIIKPKKFRLSAGDSKRITIDFKSKNKKSPIYGFLEFSTSKAKGAPPVSIPVVLVPEGLKQKLTAKFSDIKAVLTAGGTRVLFNTEIHNSKSSKEALYLNSSVTATNLETGIMVHNTQGRLSTEHLLPGTSVSVTGEMDFAMLKDGVYKLLFKASSDEGGLSIGKEVNLVINRDIAKKVRVVVNE
jgi:uncharacterized cupredoxin-like copper-binding protein